MHSLNLIFQFLFTFALLHLTQASPSPSRTIKEIRQASAPQPSFPPVPTSCPLCGEHFQDTIVGCADAAAAFQDPIQIIFNPAAFIEVLECGCSDLFQSVFPQCADCFIQTNQTAFLNSQNIPAALSGMRQVCALASSLFNTASSSLAAAGSSFPVETNTVLPSPSTSTPILTTPAAVSSAPASGGGDTSAPPAGTTLPSRAFHNAPGILPYVLVILGLGFLV